MDSDAYEKHNKPEAGSHIGIYKHPDSDQELHASSFPQADAFVRQGWVYDRPLPKRDTKVKSEIANVDDGSLRDKSEDDSDKSNKKGDK